jgi:hypothetical protein
MTLQRVKQEWQKSPALGPGKQTQKLGLVWINRKKISQIINPYSPAIIVLPSILLKGTSYYPVPCCLYCLLSVLSPVCPASCLAHMIYSV